MHIAGIHIGYLYGMTLYNGEAEQCGDDTIIIVKCNEFEEAMQETITCVALLHLTSTGSMTAWPTSHR